jgi:lipoprotein-anchoring transpeptidase ErfK/SrfK
MSRIAPILRRAFVLLFVLVACGAPLAYAQETTTEGTTTELPPPLIPEGVLIGDVAVGGLTADEATSAVFTHFARRFVFTFRGETRRARPWKVGARAHLGLAVASALAATPFQVVPLRVTVGVHRLRSYTAYLGRTFSRPAVSSTARLVGLRPRITRAHRGFSVLRYILRRRIRHAVLADVRGPLAVPYRVLRPRFTRANFGAVIVVRRTSHRLYLYDGGRFWHTFGVAVGQSIYPTPLGSFYIAVKQRNPWWYPPNTAWAAGATPIPPGPGNPLGTRWMGLSWGGIGIHGTPDSASIGYSASHGCIRMRIPEAEWLFERVRIGTPVFIVSA